MGNVILKGHISYAAKRKYRWIAEFGKNTCEKCAALDGKEFDEDEIPPRPHPNCRCKVEEISIVDEIESELNEYREEIEQLKLQADELLGDTSVLREQIEKLMKENNTPEVRTLDNRLAGIEYDVYKLIDKIEALNIDTISASVIQRIELHIDNIRKGISTTYKKIETIAIKYTPKSIFDKAVYVYGKYKNQRDGAAFYEIAASKFSSSSAKEYINKNGRIYEKVSDLNNRNLELFVRDKLLKQIGTSETKGVLYNEYSSVSKAITRENSFRTLISNRKEELLNNRRIEDTSLSFEQGNLRSAYHYVDIINIKLDSNDNLYALVIDTYDFNKFEDDPLVKKGGEYQDKGKLEPYYNIAILKIPRKEWINY